MHTQLHRSTKETPVVLYTMRPQLLQYRSAARNSRVNLRWKNSWSVGLCVSVSVPVSVSVLGLCMRGCWRETLGSGHGPLCWLQQQDFAQIHRHTRTFDVCVYVCMFITQASLAGPSGYPSRCVHS